MKIGPRTMHFLIIWYLNGKGKKDYNWKLQVPCKEGHKHSEMHIWSERIGLNDIWYWKDRMLVKPQAEIHKKKKSIIFQWEKRENIVNKLCKRHTMRRKIGINSVKARNVWVRGSISISKCEMTAANVSKERAEVRRRSCRYPNSVPCLKPKINGKLIR